MAKSKKSTKKKEGKDKPKRKTITSVVLAYLDKKPQAETMEIYNAIVAAGFPTTKFNKSHLAWYKHQIRKGKLKLPSGRDLPKKITTKKDKAAKSTKKDKTDKKTKKAKKSKK